MNTINEPSKLKAEVTYNAAADHFDDGPLAFWDRYGRRTVERLSLSPGSLVLDVGCGSGASAIPAAIKVGLTRYWNRLGGTAARYRKNEKHRAETTQRRLP